MRKIILLMSILAMHWATAQQQTSPDGNVVLSFSLKADGTPTYKMTYKGKPVINESTLGFTLKKEEPLTNHFKVVSDSKSTFKETYLFCDSRREYSIRNDRRPYCLVDPW